MDEKRRDFLKKAGVGTLVGLGVASAVGVVTEKEGKAASSVEETSGTRWGMVIDTRKNTSAFDKCQKACHSIHNVPEFTLEDGSPDLKNEIKWIWQEPYHNSFPTKAGEFLSDTLKSKQVTVLCNHCKNPPCTVSHLLNQSTRTPSSTTRIVPHCKCRCTIRAPFSCSLKKDVCSGSSEGWDRKFL